MGISSKTRKKLWGKSGNRCAMCRIELIKASQAQKISVIIGEECHIVSKRKTGPRYEESESVNLDSYDNLILLCRNHHKEIDSNVDGFPREKLKEIKSKHENWVKSTIDKAISPELPKIHELDRIRTGKELVEVINSVHGKIFDYSDLLNQEEIDLVGSFFDILSDYMDIFGMGVISKSEEIQLGVDSNEHVIQLEEKGFLVFGKIGKIKIYFKDKTSEVWDAAIVFVKRNTDGLDKVNMIPVIFKDIKIKL